MDNCSAHRSQKAVDRLCYRLRSKWLNALLVHTPIHASWLNQIEIYFSIFQREVLNPNEKTASPFQWTFKRSDLHALLVKIGRKRLVAAA